MPRTTSPLTAIRPAVVRHEGRRRLRRVDHESYPDVVDIDTRIIDLAALAQQAAF